MKKLLALAAIIAPLLFASCKKEALVNDVEDQTEMTKTALQKKSSCTLPDPQGVGADWIRIVGNENQNFFHGDVTGIVRYVTPSGLTAPIHGTAIMKIKGGGATSRKRYLIASFPTANDLVVLSASNVKLPKKEPFFITIKCKTNNCDKIWTTYQAIFQYVQPSPFDPTNFGGRIAQIYLPEANLGTDLP